MLFSIIIPVYNVEKYIRECLDSIVNQTFSDFEIILINDGSTDSSGDICDEYSKKYDFIQVIHQKNAGQAAARNAGLKIAKGTYIVFIDSDDYIGNQSFLEMLSEKCAEEPDIILYGYKKFFESNQSFGKPICDYPDLQKIKKPSDTIQVLLERDLYDGSPWSKAVKADILKNNDIEFLPGVISEDSDWYLQVVLHAKTYEHINEPFVIYRQRESSVSHAPKIKSLTDNIQMLERWTSRLENMQLSKDMQDVLLSVLARYYGNILILFTMFPFREVKPYYTQMKSFQYLLRYGATKRSKIIRTVSTVLGLRITVAALSMVGKLKRRM